MTLTFLLAYLFYNDGIQTVIASSSMYGEKQLGFETSVLIATILLVQFVAFGGALLFGRLAQTLRQPVDHPGGPGRLDGDRERRRCFLPENNIALFLALAVAIGLVLGGTQALSRSFFSLLIPRGKEAEYFSLYQACERGTSWFGHAGLRPGPPADRLLPAGDLRADHLLRGRRSAPVRVDPRRGIAEAGNAQPAVV